MSEPPLVGIVMGSDSDWPVMEKAAIALQELAIAYEVDVVSAHRMPDDMLEYGRSAADRGLRILVAGAGGAAHLPGMLASVTPLPVIGVPVPLAHLDGMDSLLSIVQMPAGVPWRRCRSAAPGTPDCWRRASSVRARARRPHGSARRWSSSRWSCASRRWPGAARCATAPRVD
jgi:phosphoribosylaminoimidazole carboxylase PurE protein